jgi:predicted SnoaL-like aldol condensation-catalyzing enzyme
MNDSEKPLNPATYRCLGANPSPGTDDLPRRYINELKALPDRMCTTGCGSLCTTYFGYSYIQHSAHIPPGREGLFGLIKGAPQALHYENGLTVANGDYVLLHGRFSGLGRPANWIVVDIVRLENGQLAEHWDVIQDEVTKEASVSGLPMFGDKFPG